MKIIISIAFTLTALVYLAACTTTFEEHIHPLEIALTAPKLEHVTPESFLQCEGYLTNVPAENYCAETAPNDWRAFKFNGEQFYMVPLLTDNESWTNSLSGKQHPTEYRFSEEPNLSELKPALK